MARYLPAPSGLTLMPVYYRTVEGIVTITVDGDHTGGEFRRIADEAFDGLPRPIAVLLDLSGAAGLKGQPLGSEDFFAEHQGEVSRIAVLSPAGVKRLPSGRVVGFQPFQTVETQPFNTRAEALSWLLDAPGPEEAY